MIFLRPKWAARISSKSIRNLFFLLPFFFSPLGVADAQHRSDAPKKNDQKVVVLPLITFYDVARGATYNWWSEATSESPDAQKLSRQLMPYLAREGHKKIHFLNPHRQKLNFKEELRKTVLTDKELLEISSSLGAEIVLVGDVKLEESPVILEGKRLKMDIKILRAPQFLEVGQVVRLFDLYSVDYVQLLEVGGEPWLDLKASVERQLLSYNAKDQKGKLEIVVNGSLSYQQLASFQKSLKAHIGGIKSLSPGFVDKDSFGIFVEYEGSDSKALTEDLKHLEMRGFMTQVVSSSSSQVIFDVHPKVAVK